jgi:drug/metabolite transporter (DMT)-like permease
MQQKAEVSAARVIAAPSPLVHRDRVVLGMACAAAGFFSLNTMNVFAKLLSAKHSVLEVAFYRNVVALIPFVLWIFLLGHREVLKLNSRWDAVAARSIFGTLSLIGTFEAFDYLPLADAQALFFTSSLFIPIVGYFILKEKVGPYRWGAVVAGFLGLLVIVHPTGSVNVPGVTLAVGVAMLQAGLGTLLRILGRSDNPETVTFYFLLIGAAVTAPTMPFVAITPGWNDVPLFIGVGIAGASFQFFLSAAYKYAPMALVSILNYTGIVWATAYGWFIWGDWPGPPVWIGAGIIIASSLFIVWREQRAARRQATLPGFPAIRE